ncbi:30S ribosomal protein S16 [Patescibacteria group bacterium]|nr:30S ribosomal protein S16 [Patescibacteria group bacterium]
MLAIKLSRTGKKKQPYYRIIVLEKSKDPWGDYKELLGNYNPRTKELVIKEDRLKYWISVGAQMSNTVHNLMIKNSIIDAKPKKAVTISKKRTAKMAKKDESKKEEAPKDAPAEEKPAKEAVDEKKEEAPKEEAPEEKVEEKKEEIKEEKKEEPKETPEEKKEEEK